jgi:hypothetical protein
MPVRSGRVSTVPAEVRNEEKEVRTVDVVGNDAISLETGVELVAHAVNDDGVESDAVEEVEAQGEALHVVGEDRTADLDDGEVGGRGEDLEVTADLTARGERVEETDDCLLLVVSIVFELLRR